MATDLGQPRGSKRLPTARYDAYAQNQLSRVESRIRALDLGAALLGFIAGTLAFALAMIFADRRWEFSAPVRQAAFLGYLVASVAYLALAVARPMRRRVNPYYAALKLEETLPEAKNSVINWVDLHNSELAPAISAAVGQRAAHDLAKADLEQAISGKKAGWAGALSGLLFLLFLTAFILFGPRHFFSLFRRSFLPFEAGAISSQTSITLLRPEDGNAVIPIGRPVTIAVQVRGRLPDPKGPDALRLLYRYQENDPFIERPLQRESGDEWAVTVNIFDVQNGFWYKVAGGDGETEEYRITVRSTPLLTGFRATYQFRPYTGRPEELRRDRRLEAVRGTSVALHFRTNRPVKEAFFDFLDKERDLIKKAVRANKLADDSQGFQTQFVLEETGQYRIRYTSTEGETYADPTPFPIVVHPDAPPAVKLTKPGQEVTLPANGVLKLEGHASDDFGVKELILRLQLVNGGKLKSQPYRVDKGLQLKSGGYPTALAYKDFVDMSKVLDPSGKPLVAGQKLEYWLEATDACDYPQANVSSSKPHFRVRIVEPEEDVAQQKEERDRAAQEKQKNEAQQDEQNKKEDQRRQEDARQRKDEIAKDKQDQPANEPRETDGNGPKKPGGQSEENKNATDEGKTDNNSQSGQDPGKQQDLRDKEEKLQDALTKKDQTGGENSKGEAKGDRDNEVGKDKADNSQSPQAEKNAAKDQSPAQGGSDKKDNAKDQAPAQGGNDKKDNAKDQAPAQGGNDKKDNAKDQSPTQGANDKKDAAKDQAPAQGGNDKKDNAKDQSPTQGANDKKDAAKDQAPAQGGKRSDGKKDAAKEQSPSQGANDKKDAAKDQSPAQGGKRSDGKKDAAKEQSPSQGASDKKDAAKEQSPAQGGNKSADKKDAAKEQSPSQGASDKKDAGKDQSPAQGGDKKNAAKDQSPPQGANDKKDGAKEQSPGQGGDKSEDKRNSAKDQLPSQGNGKKDAVKDQSASPGGKDKTNAAKDQSPQSGGDNKEDKGDQQSKAGDRKTDQKEQATKDKRTGDSNSKPATEKCDCKGEGGRAGSTEPKAEPRDGGKGTEGGQTPRGEDKRTPASDDRDKVTKGQPKGDQQPSGRAEEREGGPSEKMDKVLRLTRDLKSKDKATREKASSELERMDADQFEKLLQQYKDLLDKQSNSDRLSKKRDESRQPEKKDAGSDKAPGANNSDQATPGDERPGEKDAQEKARGNDGKDPPNSEKKGKTGDKPGADGKPADGNAKPKNDGKEGRSGETPGTGVGLGNEPSGQGNDQPTPEVTPEPGRFRNRAGVLQLEEFKRKVDRNVLKDANISEQEYREFLNGYEEMLKKPGAQVRKPEVLPGPQTSSILPSVGARRVTPTGTATDVKSGSRPLPPPRYRDAYREFTRQLSNPEDREGK